MANWNILTDFGDTAVTVPLALLVLGFLGGVLKLPRLAAGWSLGVLGCAAAIGLLKIALAGCAKPFADVGLFNPSGHAAMTTVVYGGFAAVLGTVLQRRSSPILVLGALVPIVGIPLSRLVLQVHTPLEVAIGSAIGLVALAAIVLQIARQPEHGSAPSGHRRWAVWVIIAATCVVVLQLGKRWPTERAIHQLAEWLSMLSRGCG